MGTASYVTCKQVLRGLPGAADRFRRPFGGYDDDRQCARTIKGSTRILSWREEGTQERTHDRDASNLCAVLF